jgi:hypothetical protein
VHVLGNEADPGERAFTVAELQALFDYADEQVLRIRGGDDSADRQVSRDRQPPCRGAVLGCIPPRHTTRHNDSIFDRLGGPARTAEVRRHTRRRGWAILRGEVVAVRHPFVAFLR